MEVKGVGERHDHDIPCRSLVGEHTRFKGNAQRLQRFFQFCQQTHSFPTSSSNFCCMAATAAALDALLAGFRKGLAGCPCLPYSMMLAILALLPPSERGSEKPILMLWFPLRSTFAGERPSAPSSSPEERDGYFVSFPITEDRAPRTFSSTTSPPASSTFSATGSKSLPNFEMRSRNSSGSLISTLANAAHHLFRQSLDIHPASFDILHGNNVEPLVTLHDEVFRGDGQPWDDAEAEQVGRLGESGEVCPPLAPVASFPIHTDRRENTLDSRAEALGVLFLCDRYDVGKAVHLSEAHGHTFQFRSSRSSRLTVFQTCCPACTLSAKKPPVEPSLLS
nr:MAG TPA: hypothetical protein [Caudoviricetes sp.]